MRVREADIDLSGGALHCFCGANEAGKSSISEAIRFALLGDTPRIDLKKNFGMLLSGSEKKGSVQLVADGGTIQIMRDVASGKAVTDPLSNLGASTVAALRIALGAQGFVDMDADARRKMLFDVVGVSMSPDEVADRLVAKGLPKEIVDKQIKPLLKASVDAALASAKEKLRERRAQWTATAQEPFGEQKAYMWVAPEPAKPSKTAAAIKDIDEAVKAVEQLDRDTEAAATDVGAKQAGAQQRRTFDEQLHRLDNFVANKSQIQADKRKIEAEISTLKDQISTHEEMLDRIAASEVKHLECPKCEQPLQLSADGEELEFATPQEPFVDVEGAPKRREELAQFRARLKVLDGELAQNVKRLDAIANQAELSRTIKEQQAKLPTEKDLADAEKKLNDLRQRLHVERETVQEALEHRRRVNLAAETTRRAAEIFKSWQFWSRAVELLEPSGVPGEILSEAMEKMNRRLAASAGLAGWGAPYINDDMSIVRISEDEDAAERPYSLLSESAKWRVSAVIAEVISSMAGMNLLILDRWDVLDGAGRLQFMRWVRRLASDSFDTVITMATLKGSPKEKPKLEGFEVHWVEDGVVS